MVIKPPLTIGVLVCTWRRPDSLTRCLGGLSLQQRTPDDVMIVVRETDLATQQFLKSRSDDGLPIRMLLVAPPGTVAALNTGLSSCSADILAICDDDTVAHPDWLQRIFEHFAQDSNLGGLGGRDRCHNGLSFDDRKMAVVGKLQWFGRMIGYHHVGFGKPRDVHMLKGANMSYRAQAIARQRFDIRLRGSGAQAYEDIAFSLGVRRAGWKLVYDPAVMVDHYEGPRDDTRHYSSTMPVKDVEGFRDFAYNGVVAIWDEFSIFRHLVFLVWSMLIGVRVCPGLVQAIRFTPKMGPRASWHRFWIAQQGIVSAYANLIRARRNRAANQQPETRAITKTPVELRPTE